MKRITLFVAAVIAAVVPAHANSFQVNAGGARSYDRWGVELGAGYRVQFGIFDITPGGGAFITSSHDGYKERLDSSGFPHCFGSDGHIANDSHCDNRKSRAFGMVEAGASIPLVARIAVGARYIGSEVKPYGSVAVPFLPKLAVKVNGGPHYVAAGLSLGF